LHVKGYDPETIKRMFRKDERFTIGICLYAVFQVAKGQPSRKVEDQCKRYSACETVS
jgi:hypothetical protein